MIRHAVTLLVAAVVASSAARADAIDDYLRSEMARRRIPGLALAIARDGEIVRLSSYGLANVEAGAPVDERSVFAIASLDKQITAIGVLRAAELGRLTLEDPVSRWVPEVSLPGATLRHLLSHTAGLPDQVAGDVEGRLFTSYTTAELLGTVSRLVPMARPGTTFLYSDAGLFLAQLATERAAGEPWWAFQRREVFARAGMTTPVSLAPAAIVPGRVSPYTLEGGEAPAGDDPTGEPVLVRDRRLDLDFGPLYTDLGMTAADFARLLGALDREGEAPLHADSRAALVAPTRLGDGTPAGEVFQWSRYGLGVGLEDLRGEPAVLHSGHSGVGFVRFPRRRLSVVVFTNLEHPAGSDPVGLAIGVAGQLAPELRLEGLAAVPATLEERALYEEFAAGQPELARYAPGFREAVWAGAPALAGRLPWLGAVVRVERLVLGAAASAVDGEAVTFLRCTHRRGVIYARISRRSDGLVTRLVWWHL